MPPRLMPTQHGALAILAGDIGATHTRIALFADDPRVPAVFESYASRERDSLEEMVEGFLAAHPARIGRACFGVAGPVREGQVEAPNLPWRVVADRVAKTLDLPNVDLINDLTAHAHGLALLEPQDLETLALGEPSPHGSQAVISAGTGLGEAGLIWDGRRYVVVPSEGGHGDFAPRTEVEWELCRWLAAQDPHVSCERVCSGLGLHNVYRFLRARATAREPSWLGSRMATGDPGTVISHSAIEGSDPVCVQALDLMVSAYGAEAGNLALKYLATGGVYVGGGIAPHILPKLRDGTFLRAFTAKGRMSEMMRRIPVHVVLNERTALLGAARYAREPTGTGASAPGPTRGVSDGPPSDDPPRKG